MPLRKLWWLDLKGGGLRSLSLLPRVGRLKYLELWLIKGLNDIGAIGELPDLQFHFLQALRQVTRLPSLRGCTSLRRVHLQTMRGLRDLSGLAEAPALEELRVVDGSPLQPADFECLERSKPRAPLSGRG